MVRVLGRPQRADGVSVREAARRPTTVEQLRKSITTRPTTRPPRAT